ncbi:MAG: glycosyltransferase [Pseudomonadota bacterium]
MHADAPALSRTPKLTTRTRPTVSILVPRFRDDVLPLIEALGASDGASETHLIAFDDGSGDAGEFPKIQSALTAFPGPAELIISETNLGRSEARNRLLAAATTDWVILLDADMVPDDPHFLTRYQEAAKKLGEPGLICGGGSTAQVQLDPKTALHLAQSRTSECLDAKDRNAEPGRFVFTANIMVHRTVFDTVPLDPGYVGWGWEDVDWGLSIAARFPVVHIDNPATHLGLDEDARLIAKYGSSGANFARLKRRHPEAVEAMPLYKAAHFAQSLGPLRTPLTSLTRFAATRSILPMRVRLASLKLFRALVYSRDL